MIFVFLKKQVLYIFTLYASAIEFWIAQAVLPVVGLILYLAKTRYGLFRISEPRTIKIVTFRSIFFVLHARLDA
jgi:hypothetical protein